MSFLPQHTATLAREMDWLSEVIACRFALYFEQNPAQKSIKLCLPPELGDCDSFYSRLVRQEQMNFEERLLLCLALAPHLKPQLLDVFFTKNTLFDRGFTEFGGLKGQRHAGFLPTGETAAFILAGKKMSERLLLFEIFDKKHFFYTKNILKLSPTNAHEPILSGQLEISSKYLWRLIAPKHYEPARASFFLAESLKTKMDWDDLVVAPEIMEQIQEIILWKKHGDALQRLPGLGKKIRPGLRCLFYGSPGTGKTLTAALLAKICHTEVYRIDLSKVVSKYIGETEKNLAQLFDQAEQNGWILFFDEADALFGKRSSGGGDAKAHYANQEIAYLLQRIEYFSETLILATNLKINFDQAFARRFELMIYFSIPNADLRLKIWKNTLKDECFSLDPTINWAEIANRFAFSGGAIVNICRYCALMAFQTDERHIRAADLEEGIRRELRKSGKTH